MQSKLVCAGHAYRLNGDRRVGVYGGFSTSLEQTIQFATVASMMRNYLFPLSTVESIQLMYKYHVLEMYAFIVLLFPCQNRAGL